MNKRMDLNNNREEYKDLSDEVSDAENKVAKAPKDDEKGEENF